MRTSSYPIGVTESSYRLCKTIVCLLLFCHGTFQCQISFTTFTGELYSSPPGGTRIFKYVIQGERQSHVTILSMTGGWARSSCVKFEILVEWQRVALVNSLTKLFTFFLLRETFVSVNQLMTRLWVEVDGWPLPAGSDRMIDGTNRLVGPVSCHYRHKTCSATFWLTRWSPQLIRKVALQTKTWNRLPPKYSHDLSSFKINGVT